MLDYMRKLKVFFNERLNFLEKVFSSDSFPQRHFPFGNGAQLFLFNLSLIFISCEGRTVITHKMVS